MAVAQASSLTWRRAQHRAAEIAVLPKHVPADLSGEAMTAGTRAPVVRKGLPAFGVVEMLATAAAPGESGQSGQP